jgi:DNA-binding helix-hairpin-helix protein with protein kinase domain
MPMGSSPDAGQVLRVSSAPITLKIEAQVGRTGWGTILRGRTSGGDPVAVIWHPPDRRANGQRRAAAALIGLGSPHPALAWPIGIADCPQVPGWGVLMRLVPGRFVPLARLLAAVEQPSFRALARIGSELAGACGALHSVGLTYRDFDLAVPMADPATGEVIIPVLDSAGVFGREALPGALPFQAPELVRGDALPSALTDVHTLAVILFYLLVHGHPLQGRRADDPSGLVEFRHLGQDPLFVFDPDDQSNAPLPGDPMMIWWPIYPQFIRRLFTRAFTTGLADPRLGGRVTEREWQRAMIALADCVSACPCGAAVLWDKDEPAKACWRCGAVPSAPPLLRLPGHVIALTEGAIISPGHLSESDDFRTRIAVVEAQHSDPDRIMLRNRSTTAWTVLPSGAASGERQRVAPGQRWRLRAADIDFGPAQATVSLPPDF